MSISGAIAGKIVALTVNLEIAVESKYSPVTVEQLVKIVSGNNSHITNHAAKYSLASLEKFTELGGPNFTIVILSQPTIQTNLCGKPRTPGNSNVRPMRTTMPDIQQFDAIKWLAENTHGGTEISPAAREAVANFTTMWNFFESTLCENRASVAALTRISERSNADRIAPEKIKCWGNVWHSGNFGIAHLRDLGAASKACTFAPMTSVLTLRWCSTAARTIHETGCLR